MKKETEFERAVCKEIRGWDNNIRVYKMDPNVAAQGIPDRLVLCNGKFALLEFKRTKNSPRRPNQDWYVDFFNKKGFSAFIYPENKEEILTNLKIYLGVNV